MNSGIYQIENIVNKKTYIGSAVDLTKRKANHFSDLERNCHANIHLQRSYNKHKRDAFKFEILFTCRKENLIRVEQYHINNYQPQYNICKIAGSSFGVKRSEEFINSQKGRKFSEESKKKMSLSAMGRILSEETKRKMSMTKKGKPKTFKHVQKIRLCCMKPIHQMCKQSQDILHTFSSITEASTMLNIAAPDITACAKLKRKSAGGYIWRYKNKIPCSSENMINL